MISAPKRSHKKKPVVTPKRSHKKVTTKTYVDWAKEDEAYDRQQKAVWNLGSQVSSQYTNKPKRSHKKKVPVEVYSRQQKQAANFGGLYEQPKRSHKKKVSAAYAPEQKDLTSSWHEIVTKMLAESTPTYKKKVPTTQSSYAANVWEALGVPAIPGVQAIGVQLPLPGKANPDFPQTATTFWQQMEPGLHMVMQAILSKAITSKRPDKEERRRVTRRLYRAAVMSAASFFLKSSPDVPSDQLLRDQGIQAVNKAVNKAKKNLPTSATDFDID